MSPPCALVQQYKMTWFSLQSLCLCLSHCLSLVGHCKVLKQTHADCCSIPPSQFCGCVVLSPPSSPVSFLLHCPLSLPLHTLTSDTLMSTADIHPFRTSETPSHFSFSLFHHSFSCVCFIVTFVPMFRLATPHESELYDIPIMGIPSCAC